MLDNVLIIGISFIVVSGLLLAIVAGSINACEHIYASWNKIDFWRGIAIMLACMLAALALSLLA